MTGLPKLDIPPKDLKAGNSHRKGTRSRDKESYQLESDGFRHPSTNCLEFPSNLPLKSSPSPITILYLLPGQSIRSAATVATRSSPSHLSIWKSHLESISDLMCQEKNF